MHLTPQPIWGGMPSKGKVGAGSDPPLGHLLHLLGGPHHARTHRRPRRHRLRPPRPHPARPHRCRLRLLKSLASDDSWRACERKTNEILDVPGLYIQTYRRATYFFSMYWLFPLFLLLKLQSTFSNGILDFKQKHKRKNSIRGCAFLGVPREPHPSPHVLM